MVTTFTECKKYTDKIMKMITDLLVSHDYEVSADSLISLYDKISSQEIKVFVAMPYFEGNSEIVADYNTIYYSKINEISKKYNINISLFPIMCEKGATQDQIQDIINRT